ncbi:cytoplasmic protein [Candidatus Magnetomorum sp. HK-1]|nr:cytoplasmic protein [Candidatus Magnetomorum sp. HK-1]
MSKTKEKEESQELSKPEQVGKSLFEFSIDREDIKWLLEQQADDSKIPPNTIEYELQLLKIISVGWSISFYLVDHPLKDAIAEFYWHHIQSFSETIASTTELTIGKKIDYFSILKERLDTYVDALKRITADSDPLKIVGPEFANFCGNKDDVFSVLTGSKLFATTLNRVKEYLEGIDQ